MGDLQHDGIQLELIAQLLGYPVGIGAGPVALVDKGDAGNLVPGHLPVNRDGLRLHPAHRAEDQHRAVENPQSPLNLDGEVNMARGIDNIDIMIPSSCSRWRPTGW